MRKGDKNVATKKGQYHYHALHQTGFHADRLNVGKGGTKGITSFRCLKGVLMAMIQDKFQT